jgi:hypothetical protein
MDRSFSLPIILYALACVIPVLVAGGLWLDGRTFPFAHLAAIFTLKPVLVVPFWFPIMALLKPIISDQANYRISVTIALTAISGTVIILWCFRRHITEVTFPAIEILFGLDTLRWLSTLGLILIEGGWWCLLPVSLTLPTIFAAVAFWQVRRLKRARPGARET